MAQEADGPDGLDDFDRIVAAFNRHHVEFMIVGAFAVIYHGHVRDTSDLDLYIRSSRENAERAVAALEEAGFGSPDLKPEVFTHDNGIHLGEEPVEVDVLSTLKAVQWDRAWARRQTGPFGPEDVNYIALPDLIANKRAVGRLQDLADVEKLENINDLIKDKQPRERDGGRGFER